MPTVLCFYGYRKYILGTAAAVYESLNRLAPTVAGDREMNCHARRSAPAMPHVFGRLHLHNIHFSAVRDAWAASYLTSHENCTHHLCVCYHINACNMCTVWNVDPLKFIKSSDVDPKTSQAHSVLTNYYCAHRV